MAIELFLNVINCKLSTNNLYSLFVLLQALERGCVCEERVLSGRGAKKYGSMLSRLFERSWEKNHLSDSNSWDIINFTLSWKPFEQFLDMFCKWLMIWETYVTFCKGCLEIIETNSFGKIDKCLKVHQDVN